MTYEKYLTLIVSLRGYLPEKCDFCGQPYENGRYPIPEEAGEWACNECQQRWQLEEQARQREEKANGTAR